MVNSANFVRPVINFPQRKWIFRNAGRKKSFFRNALMETAVKLWILSDWHMEGRFAGFAPPRPEFDVLVCAGDVSNDIVESIGMARALADDKLAVFVAGNHEYWGDMTVQATLERGYAAAKKQGVAFLECSTIDAGGVRFGGATMWTPDDPRFTASIMALSLSRCDVAITHFEPSSRALVQVGAAVWVCGHHHGHSDLQAGRTRIVRNAVGGPNEPMGEPARLDFVVEI